MAKHSDNLLEGIEYPRPGYSLGWEYSAAHNCYRLRLAAPFPHPDDEWAEPKLFTFERTFDAYSMNQHSEIFQDTSYRVRLVRDVLHHLETSVADQWLVVNGRPYKAPNTTRKV